jgi:hypothetical protein
MTVGILSDPDDFTRDLVEELKQRGVPAELFTLRQVEAGEAPPYGLVVDRASYLDKFVRSRMKAMALAGAYIINNPFADSADDKFFEYALAERIGVRVPRTVLLPAVSPEYDLGAVVQEPDLQEAVRKIGFPAILKPFDGYGWRNVFRLNSLEELDRLYHEHIDEVFVLQEYIEYQHYVRAFVIGKRHVLPVKYEPAERKYVWHPKHLSAPEGKEVVESCIRLNRALDYDFNTVEFALKDGKAYAIDFWNTVPEVEPRDLPHEYYRWIIEHLARHVMDCLKHPRPTRYIWGFLQHRVTASHSLDV